MTQALACIVCKKELQNVSSSAGNQPMSGIEFHSYGHYGSEVFDPGNNGEYLVINICDDCAFSAAEHKLVLHGQDNGETFTTDRKLKTWSAD